MKAITVMIILGALAGCGADGAPLRPTANLGLSIGADGVTPTASIGATSGPVSIRVGS